MITALLIRMRVIGLLLAFAWLLTGCQKQTAAMNPDVDYYTCTMHPSVHSHDPKAKCPICSMDLVPVLKKGARDAAATNGSASPLLSEFRVPVARQQQIGVTYAVAQKRPLHQTIRAVGVVELDRGRRWEFVARVEGYVQRLYVTSAGEPIEAETPLLTIYSPDLSTAERELVNLLAVRDGARTAEARTGDDQAIEAARRRLEQWNVTASQIADLEKSRKPSDLLTLYSPFKGMVENVPIEQGRKVVVGDPLVDVADLSMVWVWAELYEDELPMLAKGQKVEVTAGSYPGETFPGELSLVDPFLAAAKRTVKVRVDLPNSDFKLKPGMYVNVELAIEMGEGLTIPVSAVMPTGARTLVFVDKGEGKLEPRFVELGRKYGDFYEAHSGLKEGERVVSSANFLIDAESKVQGAVKSFEEPATEGAN
jgi:Cu(I)/Ag(I) efflux system membrane fusion protein